MGFKIFTGERRGEEVSSTLPVKNDYGSGGFFFHRAGCKRGGVEGGREGGVERFEIIGFSLRADFLCVNSPCSGTADIRFRISLGI